MNGSPILFKRRSKAKLSRYFLKLFDLFIHPCIAMAVQVTTPTHPREIRGWLFLNDK